MDVAVNTCAERRNVAWYSPPPPFSPPPADGTTDGWIFVGVLLCVIGIGMLCLGTTVQKYGLTVVVEKGCCGSKRRGMSTAVWLFGWIIYASGNGVYTFAVTLAPATVCSALVGLACIWNGLIARLLLGERLEACDLQGGTLIMSGIAMIPIFGPTESIEHTAPQFLALLLNGVGGQVYLACVVLLILGLATFVMLHERSERVAATKPSVAMQHAGGEARGAQSSQPSQPPIATAAESPSAVTALVPFAYPIIVGSIESLQTLCLIASSRMFFRSLQTDDSQFCYATFWAVSGSLALMVVGQVWWLRKALLKLAVSRVLPIEYGTVACLSVLGSVILFQEGVYVPDNFGWGIASGIALIMLGCGQVGSRYSPWPACCGLFPAAKRTLKMPAEVVLQNAAPRQVSRVVDDEDQVVVSVEQV